MSVIESRFATGAWLVFAATLISSPAALAQDEASSAAEVLFPDRMSFYERVARGSSLPDDMKFYDVDRQLVAADSIFEAPYTVRVS